MAEVTEQFESFAYQAQTVDGQAVAGTIDASNVEQAQRLLQTLRLRVLQVEPVQRPPRTKRLNGVDFLAFNQQLTQLTSAGLPVEHGLRLIAQDMRSGKLRATVQQLASELERGTPLDQAFEKHRDQFPPLYARLVAAGIATSNLPGMLLSLGRHMEMVFRLRATLWRAAAYPMMVLAGLMVVVAFLSTVIVPQFRVIFKEFGTRIPTLTALLLTTPDWVPILLIAIVCIVLAIPLIWQMMKLAGVDRAFVDSVVTRLPLVGPVVRRNLVARWCDAVRLGVQGGLDLPKAIELAGDAVASPALKRDGHEMIGALESGRAVDAIVGSTRLLPATVPAAMALASERNDLPATLATLSEMYQQQAETKLNTLPGLLTPLLILLVAGVIGLVIAGLFLPFIGLFQALTGSK